jgi:CRISPR-associated protein Cmr6
VGLGAEHALETSITLDRNSGLPIIPGSALKGLARHSALIDIAKILPFDQPSRKLEQLNALDNWLEQEKLDWKAIKRITGLEENPKASEINAYREIFGTVKKVGSIIFVEGIPIHGKGPYFRLDVMTPHFGDYYTHNKPPSEDQNPIPVTYLTLNSRQIFRFALLPRTQNDTAWVEQARNWLQTGLKDYGVGAKTAQGYGLFKMLEGMEL